MENIKYSFRNDYSELAHADIIDELVKADGLQYEGYGDDVYCMRAADLIKTRLKTQDVDIHFVSGGTQANLLVISSALRPHESVIAVSSGHIAVHETGAIESTGHKVHTVTGRNGKVTVEDIQIVLDVHTDEHMVKPRLVYVSNSTEVGTVYTQAELTAISAFCKSHDLLLYLDGARLGVALTSPDSDLTLPDIAALTDAFYIGGTKNGAMLGEAIVIVNPALKTDFRYQIKQKGALLAKGSLIGIQFFRLFKENLYFDLALHANQMASRLAQGIALLGYAFLEPCQTNQIFPILPNRVIDEMQKKYDFYVWSRVDRQSSAVRLVTSWATDEAVVDVFLEDLGAVE